MHALADGFRIDLAREASFSLGGAEVRPSAREIAFGAARETVEPQVMKVLVTLNRKRGEVVSRDELIHWCWGGRIVGEDAINRCLAKVRRLTERMEGVALETIPRIGYRLNDIGSPAAAVDPVAASHRRRLAFPVLAGLLLLLAGALLGYRYWSREVRAPTPTFAVLPLTSLNSGEEVHLYGKSIAAATIHAFSRASLSLVSTAPLAPDPHRSPADLGRDLGAAYVISGTIRREGDVVRAFARIDQVDGGVMVYSRMFELPAAEMRFLPDLVAGGLAGAITSAVPIVAREPEPQVRAGVLRALLAEDPRRGLEAARETVALAPDSGSAQFALALRSHHILSRHDTPEAERRALVGPARAAAARAGALLSGLGDAHVLACLLSPRLAPDGCEDQLRRGLAAEPSSSWIPTLLAPTLAESGYLKEGLKFHASAHAADPFHAAKAGHYLYHLDLLGRTGRPETEPLIRAGQLYWRTDTAFAELRFKGLVAAGEMDAAGRLLEDPMIGPMIERPGREQPIRAVLDAVRSRSAGDIARARAECGPAWLPREIAVATCLTGLAAIGDLDGAFALAERAYPDRRPRTAEEAESWFMRTGGSGYTRAFLFGTAAAPLRADPRFIGIAQRSGLLDHWRARRRPPDFCERERVPVCRLLGAGA